MSTHAKRPTDAFVTIRKLEQLEPREVPAFLIMPELTGARRFERLATGDFNGDGKGDIAGAYDFTAPAAGIEIFLGNGDGTFTSGAVLDASGFSKSAFDILDLTTADLNGDGKLDLIAAESNQSALFTAGQVLVFFGNGDGTFQAKQVIANISSANVRAGDFDGDGKLDLLVVDLDLIQGFSQSFGVLKGDGNGNFTPVVPTVPPAKNLSTIAHLPVADMDGDGKLDFAYISTSNGVVIQYGNGDGTFGNPLVFTPSQGVRKDLVAADFTGDGLVDLVGASDTGGFTPLGLATLYTNQGSRTFDTAGVNIPLTSNSFLPFGTPQLSVADYNADGTPDIAALDGSGRVFVSYNFGFGTFVPDSAGPFFNFGDDGQRDIVSLDVDGDGNSEIAYNAFFNSISNFAIRPLLNLNLRPVHVDLSAPSQVPFNSTITLVATVTPTVAPFPVPPPPPTTPVLSGFVTVFIDDIQFGSGPIDSFGVATLNLSIGFLSPGLHDVNVTFFADPPASQSIPGFQNGDSLVLQFTVGAAPTSTTISLASPDPSTYGDPVAFTVTVPGFTEGAPAPTGTITLFDGTTPLATIPGAGTLDFSQIFFATPFGAGTRSITAAYSGDANYQPSVSAPFVVTVNQLTPTATFVVAPTPAVQGAPTRISAHIAGPSGFVGSFSGSVDFFVDGQLVGSQAVDPLTGEAVLTIETLPLGFITITGQYSGDANTRPVAIASVVTQVVDAPTFVVGTDNGPVVCIYNGSAELRHGLATFGEGFLGVRAVTADLNGDGVAEVIAGSGPGNGAQLIVFDDKNQQALLVTNPFEPSFTGGVYTAVGDINGDGVPDIIVTPAFGGGPRVRIYDGRTLTTFADFFGINDVNFRGGARAAADDINGDGRDDLLVVAGEGGGPRVAGYDGTLVAGGVLVPIFADFFAFAPNLTDGIFITAGDVNGDGFSDVIVGAGTGGAPRVTVFSGRQLVRGQGPTAIADFFAGETSSRGGIRVTARDMNLDGQADVITGAGLNDGNEVRIYTSTDILGIANPNIANSVQSFPGLLAGVYVG